MGNLRDVYDQTQETRNFCRLCSVDGGGDGYLWPPTDAVN